MNNPRLFIRGQNGNLGSDLRQAIEHADIEAVETAEEANFVALCVPSHVATEELASDVYAEKTIIDLSGAAKQRKLGQYGLMKDRQTPWDPFFDSGAQLFGNPGCIASAVIIGLDQAGLTETPLKDVSVSSIGGKSHAKNAPDNELLYARRWMDHPHVQEIEAAYSGLVRIASFMPSVTGDLSDGLLVNISGATILPNSSDDRKTLSTKEVLGTNNLAYRLEIVDGTFSLGVVIDNLRFVTANAVRLIKYLHVAKS